MNLLDLYIWGLGITFKFLIILALVITAAILAGMVWDKVTKRAVPAQDEDRSAPLKFGIWMAALVVLLTLLWPLAWLAGAFAFLAAIIFCCEEVRDSWDLYKAFK